MASHPLSLFCNISNSVGDVHHYQSATPLYQYCLLWVPTPSATFHAKFWISAYCPKAHSHIFKTTCSIEMIQSTRKLRFVTANSHVFLVSIVAPLSVWSESLAPLPLPGNTENGTTQQIHPLGSVNFTLVCCGVNW